MQVRRQLLIATKAKTIIIIASIVSSIVSKIISPWSNSGNIAISCLIYPDLSYFIKNSCLWNVSWRFLNVTRLELGLSEKKLDVNDEKTNVTLSIKYIYKLYSSSPILRTKLVITRVTHHLAGCKTHVTSPTKSWIRDRCHTPTARLWRWFKSIATSFC